MLGCDPYLACGICAESRLEPNPSYFLAVLHKRLVGTGVLLVTHVLLGRSGQLRLLACVEPVLAGACPAGRDFETRPPLRVPYDTYTASARPGAGRGAPGGAGVPPPRPWMRAACRKIPSVKYTQRRYLYRHRGHFQKFQTELLSARRRKMGNTELAANSRA